MWWLGPYGQGLSIVRKPKLEDSEWAGKPSRKGESHKTQETVMDSKREGDHQYHNPDPLYCLIGPANEIESIIEGKVLPTLVDLGAQCSSITLGMVKELKLDLHPLDTLQLRGWGGVEVGYLGYTECTLEIPEVKGFKQDVLLLAVNDRIWGKSTLLVGNIAHKHDIGRSHSGRN